MFRLLSAFYWILFSLVSLLHGLIFRFQTEKNHSENQKISLKALSNSNSYEEFREKAYIIDKNCNNNIWRQNPIDKIYNFNLISDRLEKLIQATEKNDLQKLMTLVHSGSLRNIGNISDKKMFTHSVLGTKFIVEAYIYQMCKSIDYILDYQMLNNEYFNEKIKYNFLINMYRTFGHTALILQGGSILGSCHIGVIRALFEEELLPRIIIGVGFGSILAAIIATSNDKDLKKNLQLNLQSNTNLKSIFNSILNFSSRIHQILGLSTADETLNLIEYLKNTIGNMTFDEAFNKTSKVLNILVYTDDKSITKVFNYLKTPNVIIWSAVRESSKTCGQLEILYKDAEGNILSSWDKMPSHPVHVCTQFDVLPEERVIPYIQLNSQFNINNFIISEPYALFSPFTTFGLRSYRGHRFINKLIRFVNLEFRRTIVRLEYLRLLPKQFRRFIADEHFPSLEISIAPNLTFSDTCMLFKKHDKDTIEKLIKKGERSCWYAIDLIKIRCDIELTLERNILSKYKTYSLF